MAIFYMPKELEDLLNQQLTTIRHAPEGEWRQGYVDAIYDLGKTLGVMLRNPDLGRVVVYELPKEDWVKS